MTDEFAHLGYQGDDRDPEDDLAEQELWFGPPEAPFRFQGEYDGPAWPELYTDPARYDPLPGETS